MSVEKMPKPQKNVSGRNHLIGCHGAYLTWSRISNVLLGNELVQLSVNPGFH